MIKFRLIYSHELNLNSTILSPQVSLKYKPLLVASTKVTIERLTTCQFIIIPIRDTIRVNGVRIYYDKISRNIT